MKRCCIFVPLIAFILTLTSQQSSAIILFGLDNTANLTNPGGGLPFDTVAALSNSSGSITSPTGSAIHLGGGYMLTASHVGMRPYVTFDGITFYQRDLSYVPTQVASGVDLQIFRLTTVPTVGAASLYDGTGEEVAPATLVGWGRGRNDATPVNSTVVPWGDNSTIDKRWGLNTPKALTDVEYGSFSYEAISTVLGSASGSPSGLGDNEAAAAQLDSGSALFQNIGGTWYLIGVTAAVEIWGTSTFGNDQVADPNGDFNYFVRVSNHHDAIISLIPEPSVAITLGIAALLPLRRRR